MKKTFRWGARKSVCGLTLVALSACSGSYPEGDVSEWDDAKEDGEWGDDELELGTASQALGTYYGGAYRNVFLELGKTQSAIDSKLNTVYNTYFSTTDANRIYYEFGTDKAYILDVQHNDVRSEGMSYGMMITLQRNDQAKFNKLWRFALEKMRITSSTHPNYRYFAWVTDTAGNKCDENSAPDGEEYMAMSLYFAHNRWGSAAGTGHDNYKYWADEVVSAMKNRTSITGNRMRKVDASGDDGNPCTGTATNSSMTVGSLFDTAAYKIRFDPSSGNNWTDPSYHLPSFYILWSLWGPSADASFWNTAATTSRTFFSQTMSSTNGLSPDYANYDGTPHVVAWNPNSGKFAYDSYRTGGNLGMDYAWFEPTGTQHQARANSLITFFYNQGATTYNSVWNLDGTGGSGGHAAGLVGMNAVATLAATSAVSTQSAAIVNNLWDVAMPAGTQRYYDGLLYTFGLLHMSGQYKIYAPSQSQQAFQMSADQVVMEAESFDVKTANGSPDNWTLTADGSASGSNRMDLLANDGTVWTANVTTTAPRIDYRVNFTSTGTFYLWLRGSGINGNDDSTWAGADNAVIATNYAPNATGVLTWQSQTVTVNSTGLHTVSVWGREDGFRLDKVVVNKSATAPSGNGPAQSPRL